MLKSEGMSVAADCLTENPAQSQCMLDPHNDPPKINTVVSHPNTTSSGSGICLWFFFASAHTHPPLPPPRRPWPRDRLWNLPGWHSEIFQGPPNCQHDIFILFKDNVDNFPLTYLRCERNMQCYMEAISRFSNGWLNA